MLAKFNFFVDKSNNKSKADMIVVGCCTKDLKRCKEIRKNEFMNILKFLNL